MLPLHVHDPIIIGLVLLVRPAAIFEQAHVGVDIFEDVTSIEVSGVSNIQSQLTSIVTEPF